MSSQLWEILVPASTNLGEPIPLAHHQEWDRQIAEIAGGLTILKKTKGTWTSPSGKQFKEEMIPVRIACTEDQIEQIADLTAGYYDQEAVAFYIVSPDFRIKHYR